MNEFKKVITLQNMLCIQMLCLDLCLLRLGTTQEEKSSKDNNIPTSTKHFKVLLYLPYLGAVEQCWIKIYIQFIHQLKVQSYLTPVYFFCKWEWYFRLILMNDLTLLHLARTLPAWNIQECSTPLCLYNYAMLTKTINLKCTKMQHIASIKRATLSDASKMP